MSKADNDQSAPDGVEVPAGMQVLERLLNAELAERRQKIAAMSRLGEGIRIAPAESAVDPQKNSPQRLREQVGMMRKSVQPPEPVIVSAQTAAALDGKLHVPPYDFQWTWSGGVGDFVIDALAANAASGDATVDCLATGNNGDAVARARAAVGVSFKPPAPGLLQISTAPSFSYDWVTLCLQQQAISYGFVGFVVVSTALDGTSPSTDVQTFHTLWIEDSWWSGSTSTGSSAGYALAAQTPVSDTRNYSVWVWCGVHAEAGHDALWWFALAHSTLSIKVAYITCLFSG
jgi:hypothetical protein